MTDFGLPGTLVIIRHAQSTLNAAKRGETFWPDAAARDAFGGIPDHQIPLTDLGLRQAAETGVALKARFGAPGEVIHSGYLRTVQTADGILAACSDEERARVDLRMDARVRERNTGWAYNMTEAEVRAHFPWLKDYWKTAGPFLATPPGGESLAHVVDRVEHILNAIAYGEEGRTCYIVTHGNTIRCLRFLLEKMTYAQVEALRWPPNCGIVAYAIRRGVPKLIAENEQYCAKS